MDKKSAYEIAKILLELGCVELSPSKPFHYASGLKGPIYCDNRKILSHPSERAVVIKALNQKVKDKAWVYDFFAGLATAGIPHAAMMASELDAPMVYVRSKPKSHGKRQQIEGDFKVGQSLVLVEDLVNQGASLHEALLGVQDAGLKVTSCLSIVSYETQAANKVISDWGLDFECLTNFDSLCEVALELGKINQQELVELNSWKNDPVAWSKQFSSL